MTKSKLITKCQRKLGRDEMWHDIACLILSKQVGSKRHWIDMRDKHK